MKETLYLYRVAEKKNIPVIRFPLPENGSLCVQDDSGRCFIGMDETTIGTEADERVHLAHELGHCVTGSFYNRWAACDVRRKHENRADKWAIRRLIPKGELTEAVSRGYTEPWELAELFNVTEGFIKKAMCLYTHGNLATELYF